VDPALTDNLVSTAVLVVVTLLLWVIIRRMGKAALVRVASRTGKPDAQARALTLWSLLSRLLLVALTVFFVFTAAGIWGVPLGGLVAVGSAVGVALGLGAQNLVRDVIGGFFILAEGQYVIGDVVTISNVTGEVQQVRPRVTVLRDIDGNVYYVPNGSIVVSTNQSQEYAHVVFDIGMPYDTDVERALTLVKEELDSFTSDPEWADRFMEEARVLGVERLTESTMVVRGVVKTQPGERWAVRREGYRRLKSALDRAGVPILST
jgi:moderate conductance mechanosensitive channel